MSKVTVSTFLDKKENQEKITMLTAYDYSTAHILDAAGVDCLLVGDSLGMTMLGYEDTLSVTMDDMIHHCKAVKRGTQNALVVCDMPFLSYHISVEQAVANAGRMVKEAGANAVKLEGGKDVAEQIKGVIAAQIPVMGHLGLTPQSVNMLGGFKVQGKSEEQAKALLEEALMLEALGCFSIVLECVPEKLATYISKQLKIPTIGIGAGAGCDGQVLVVQDMLGMNDRLHPKFVKKYTNLKEEMMASVRQYCDEVRSGAFPEEKHTFKLSDGILEKLY